MFGGRFHRLSTLVLSLLMAAIGVALVVQALTGSGVSARLLLGVLFIAAAAGRLYVERRRGRRA